MIIDRETLERLTGIDLILMQRFARRSLQRSQRLLARTRRPEGIEEEDRPAVIAGLETYWTSSDGWTLRVTAGAVIAPPGTPTADTTRPGTWSGKDDTDEDSSYIFELPNNVTVTPTSAPGGALASAEWWVVYARMETAIVESDSARKVFNQTTGTFDPASTTQKIGAYRTTIRIVRGDPGANLAHSSTQLPGGGSEVALAFVWIPAGATDLAAAQIYDVRPLHMHDHGPNEVGGAWSMSYDGVISAPYTFSNQAISGHVWARHRGETLEILNPAQTTLVGQLQPGASWGSGAGLNKIAWIYLCRVRGAVPRYVRLGEDNVGDNTPNDGPRVAGVLVISPTPPKLRVGQAGSSSTHRWDLRASASIALPDAASPQKTHHFGGVTCAAEDAICVGMIGYDVVDAGGGPSGQDIPKLTGPVALTPDGWIVGAGINARALSFLTPSTSGNAATTGTVEADVNEINVTGNMVTLPILGLRASVVVSIAATGNQVDFKLWSSLIRRHVVADGGGLFAATAELEGWSIWAGWRNIVVGKIVTTSNMASNPFASWIGLRFPTREPLVTG